MADVKGGCMKKCSCGRVLEAGQTVHFECWKRKFDARKRVAVKKVDARLPGWVEKVKVYA